MIGENVDDIVGVVYLKDLVRRTQGDQDTSRIRVEEIMRPASFVRSPSRSTCCCATCRPAASTWPWWSTSTAGSPACSPSRTSSRRSSARSTTSTTRSTRPPVEELPDGSYRVTARLPVEDLADLFRVELPEDDDVETVGGLLARAIGRVPIEGSETVVGELHLLAESTGGRRNQIDTMLVRRVEEEPEVAEPEAEDAEEPEDDERAERRRRKREKKEAAALAADTGEGAERVSP